MHSSSSDKRHTMSGFELLQEVLKINQIIELILQHVQDRNSINEILEDAKTRAHGISPNLFKAYCLADVDHVLADFFGETIKEFRSICEELQLIEEKLAKCTTARSLMSPHATVTLLKDVFDKLHAKEENIKLIGMIAELHVGQCSCENRIQEVITELNNRSDVLQPARLIFCHVCQTKLSSSEGTLIKPQHRLELWINEVDTADKLATGIAFYQGNQSIRQDFKKAARYLHAALNAGDTEANYYLGKLYSNGSGVETCYSTAFEYFSKGTAAKDPKAMGELADCYAGGRGVECCYPLSVAYAKMATEGGDPLGMAIRAAQKVYGVVTDRNVRLAQNLSKRAVHKGCDLGKATQAACFMYGLGVEQDVPKAIKLWTEALEKGSFFVRIYLAQCYETGIGVNVDYGKAAEYYKHGVEDVSEPWIAEYSQAYYGMCLVQGKGVIQNVERGWSLIRSSVQANRDSGWFVQGECYRLGYGVRKNMAKAFESYKNATRVVHFDEAKFRAHYELGRMYESGEVVDCDYVKAFEQYCIAASDLDHNAHWKVARFCESGIGVDQDTERAVQFFRLAANSGHRAAQIKAFDYYMKGKGVQRNIMSDANIIQYAAQCGNEHAKRLLRRFKQSATRFRLSKSSKLSI